MKKLAVLIITSVFCITCYAEPNKATASKWLAEFRTAHEKKGDALFLNDPVKRSAHMQTLMKLQDRAEKLFGQSNNYQYDVCIKASIGLASMWQDEIDIARGSPNAYITASGLANMAWESGQSYGACRDLIDSMK
jgi:hypothetical protein